MGVWSSVVTTGQWLVVLVRSTRSGDSRASVGSVVAGAVVVVSSRGSKASRRRGNDSNLGVTESVVATVSLPELDAGAFGVVVLGTGAKTLLLLVLAAHEELEEAREEEEDSTEDGHCEASSVQAANGAERSRVGDLVALSVAAEAFLGVGGSITQGSAHESRAAVSTVTGHHSNGNHSTAAQKVEDDAEECEEGLIQVSV